MEELQLKTRLEMFDKNHLTLGIEGWRIKDNRIDPIYILHFFTVRGEIFEVNLQKEEVDIMPQSLFEDMLLEKLKETIISKYLR